MQPRIISLAPSPRYSRARSRQWDTAHPNELSTGRPSSRCQAISPAHPLPSRAAQIAAVLSDFIALPQSTRAQLLDDLKRAGGPPIPWSFALVTCQSSSDCASIRRSAPLASAPGGARQGVASTTHLYCTALSNFEIPRLGTVLGSQLVRMSLAWSRF